MFGIESKVGGALQYFVRPDLSECFSLGERILPLNL
jgi:hypothetical protein